jgi:K+-sensing histidine kinase KdpD
LIENAFLYTLTSLFSIDIEFEFFSNKFTFTVADEGLGMNHFEQENLFKKFIRGESKNTIPGAGIGLTLVYAAVKELGGDIKVKSSEGMGAMFVATIPFTPITQHQEQSHQKNWEEKRFYSMQVLPI